MYSKCFRIVACLFLLNFIFVSNAVCGPIEDDIDLDFLLEENFGLDKPKKKTRVKKNNVTNKNVQKKEQTENNSFHQNLEKESKKKEQEEAKKKANKEVRKISLPNVDLLTKVRKRMSFVPEEVEHWVINTSNINTCYENGQTMLLYILTRYTDVESVKILINSGADLQTRCNPRYEALFIAAINNPSPEVMEVLVNNGANIVERDSEKNTALILAATFNKSANVLNTLLDYGLKTDTYNSYGYNALMLAAYENGRIPILQTLLDNEADINATDADGHTALMAAAVRGRDEVIEYLIFRGANGNLKDKNGMTVKDYYRKRYYLNLPEYKEDATVSPSSHLKQAFNFIAEKHHFYNDALKKAVYAKNADEEVKMALDNLADVDVFDDNKCTPLLNAVKNNAPLSVIEKLVKRGANVNATCLGGVNAMMMLAAISSLNNDVNMQVEKAQYLLDHGFSINAQDERGNNALMYAIGYKADNKFLLLLLKNGINVNAVNDMKTNPLWLAVKQNLKPDAVKLLLEYDADVQSLNEDGENLLWYQLRHNGNEKITQVLLRGGINADLTNKLGDYPIWYAFYHDAPLSVLENIAMRTKKPDVRNDEGDTPLLYAVKKEYPATLIKALLENGADPDLTDNNGHTMYDIMSGNRYFDETMQRVTRDKVLRAW